MIDKGKANNHVITERAKDMLRYRVVSPAVVEVTVKGKKHGIRKRIGCFMSKILKDPEGKKVRAWQYVPIGKKWNEKGQVEYSLCRLKEMVELSLFTGNA